ncbi:MAG: 1-(5-phosphoribosyl)-5-[(5-phosphoribosylamino)methylideneamino]imidazole-4-carboxamide isomerase [Deltaproteobacteria bacterium RIFCSPLOWO2_02_FULL_57_26]|nr:MAG: 1-(5-phosphoribosyl)-5-[(5-phosphoribosylamino)methylideneamino]imidazole-4-carboxamide isomerase [Deltaproteobacteria bacterium RIFCSPLOWO2_02_FULL_57_26]
MLIIPAIDIKGGRCVRLFQGEMEKETIYFDSPLEAARHWVDQGAEFLHVVDLDGAVAGRPVHTQEVAAICMGFGVPLEMGGGLRSLEAIEAALALGVARVVVGTAAYADRDLLRAACKRFSGKVAVGIDAREGRVAIKGWKENTSTDAAELAQRCEQDGASWIIYTDISRDGTATGVDTEQTLRVARSVEVPVIASGGVASVEDIRRLKEIEREGVEAVIVGRALYAGAFTLREAIEVAAEG